MLKILKIPDKYRSGLVIVLYLVVKGNDWWQEIGKAELAIKWAQN